MGRPGKHFNFYEQHALNHRRTVELNLLLPVSLILSLLVFAMLIALFNYWGDAEYSFGYYFGQLGQWSSFRWFLLVFGIWWMWILLWTNYVLKDPVKAVMQASQAKPVTIKWQEQDPKVAMFDHVVTELALAYGMPKPATYIVENTTEPNAFATGEPGNAGVAITRPLLDMLSREEVSGVMGHELGHVMSRDSKTTLMFSYFVSGLALVTVLGWGVAKWSWIFNTDDSDDHGNTSGMLAMAFMLIGLALAVAGFVGKIVATLLKFAMSRTREYDADAMSAKVNMSPNGLIGALTKIDTWVAQVTVQSDVNNDNGLPTRYSNLYLVDNKTHLLDDHPSTKDRIERLQQM